MIDGKDSMDLEQHNEQRLKGISPSVSLEEVEIKAAKQKSREIKEIEYLLSSPHLGVGDKVWLQKRLDALNTDSVINKRE